MAEALDDGEFWLPSQFLTEEDILTDFDISTPTTESTNGFNSGLGSPADSVTETESDEEDFVAGLTRRLSRSSVVRERRTVNPKERGLSGSPKSTLHPVGGVRGPGGSGCGSSRGSPTGPVSPPPTSGSGDTAKFTDAASLNLLRAAAGQVARLSVGKAETRQQGTGFFDSSWGLLASQRKQAGPVSPPLKVNTRSHNFPAPSYSHQSHQQLQAFQFQQLWSQEMIKQQNKNGMWGQAKQSGQPIRGNNNGEDFFAGGRSNHLRDRPLGLPPAAWPPLQHAVNRQAQPQEQRKRWNGDVFAGPTGMKRESVGTGVFLPRVPNPTESRPRRNSSKMDSSKRSQGHGSSGVQGPGRNNDNACSEGVANLEIQLPSEWTY